MTGQELERRLDAAERSARWLAEKLGRSHTQVGRWLADEQPIPVGFRNEIRVLLLSVPSTTTLELGALVKPAPGLHRVDAGRRFVVRRTNRSTTGPRPPRCMECGAVLERGALIARDINGNSRDVCLEHVIPASDSEV